MFCFIFFFMLMLLRVLSTFEVFDSLVDTNEYAVGVLTTSPDYELWHWLTALISHKITPYMIVDDRSCVGTCPGSWKKNSYGIIELRINGDQVEKEKYTNLLFKTVTAWEKTVLFFSRIKITYKVIFGSMFLLIINNTLLQTVSFFFLLNHTLTH